jgi:hypothetical protein
MKRHPKANGGDAATVPQCSLGVRATCCNETLTSANDNDGPWPLIPFPEMLDSNPAGPQKVAIESARASLLLDEATAPRGQTEPEVSWRGTLARVTYLVAVSIAMFGWMYLLWWTLGSSLSWVLD